MARYGVGKLALVAWHAARLHALRYWSYWRRECEWGRV